MHYDQLFPRRCPVQASDRFTKFQRLPPEIRNMVWEFALPEPRVYEVLDAPHAKQKTPAHEGLMFANVHPEPPPALAAVCRESRYFVLHHYKPLRLGKTTKFVDVSRDILLLEPYLLVKRLHRTLHFMSQIPLVRDNVTRLALGTSYGIYPGIFHPVLGRKVSKNNMGKLLASLAKFPRLRTLIFVVHQEFQFEFDFRFPGTLTPMPSVLPVSAATDRLGAVHGHGATAGYASPPASSGSRSTSSPAHSTTTTPTQTIRGGLPSPPSSTSTSPLPPPSLPLPPFSSLPQHPPPPPPLPPQFQQPRLPQPQPQLQAQQQLHQQQHQPVPKQQQVHQAYRFKFDIEANINSPPHGRRPHTNELLYYPLSEHVRAGAGARDEFDEYEAYVNASFSSSARPGSSFSGYGSGFGAGDGGGYDAGRLDYCLAGGVGNGEATSDGEEEGEWCDPWPTNDDWRRFRRRWVRGMVAACLPAAGAAGDRNGEGEEGREVVRGGKGCENWGEKGAPVKGAGQRICLPKWKLKGASLLWRYTRGVGGVQ